MTCVYFIMSGAYLKMGHSRDMGKRLRSIESLNPSVVIVGRIPGTECLEALLHEEFRTDHHRHEWFKISERIIETLPRLIELGAAFAAGHYGWIEDYCVGDARCGPRGE